MGDGDAAAGQIGIHRLDVARARPARRRVAVVADGEGTFEVLHPRAVLAAEDVPDEADMALGGELAVVVGDDSRRLLAAMLLGVEPEHGQGGGVLVTEDAENGAFLVQRVAVELLIRGKTRHGLPFPPVVSMSLSSSRRSFAP